jgi:hypothetical protein
MKVNSIDSVNVLVLTAKDLQVVMAEMMVLLVNQ